MSAGEHFVLDAEHRVVPADLMTWARFFEDIANRRVGWTEIGQKAVSTIFLGLNHRHFGEGPPLIFETAIMGGECDIVGRCSTWPEAEALHEQVVNDVAAAPGGSADAS